MLPFAAASLLAVSAAHAAAPPRDLGLVVEPVSDNAAACGVSTAQVRDIAAAVLTERGWKLQDGAPDYLYVNVSIIHQATSSSCVFNIADAIGRRLLTGYGGHVVAFTARTGELGIAPVATAKRTITDKLHGLLQQLIATAEQDNL